MGLTAGKAGSVDGSFGGGDWGLELAEEERGVREDEDVENEGEGREGVEFSSGSSSS